jgi:hypothetical protein
MTAKSVIATGAAVAVLTGGALVVNHQTALESKPGYKVEAQGDGHYRVYSFDKTSKNKVLMGKDLTADQADNFLNTKLGRHNK